MAVSQYSLAEFRKTKAGIKIHTRIAFDHENSMVTPDKSNRTKMDNLVITKAENALHLFGRAYVDYQN